MTDKPITEDPKALAEYLVTKALEAFDLRFGGTKSDRVFERAGFQTHVRERMNNAAQTITAEVEALRDDSLMWKDGLGHCRAALDGCVKERGAAVARAERAEALLAALWTAATAACDSLGTGVGSDAIAKTAQLGRALADTAAAAEAYRASVEAPLRAEIERITAERDEGYRWGESHTCAAVVRAESAERERDTLAAALAESRRLAGVFLADCLVMNGPSMEARERYQRALATLPADIAAGAFRRERAEALEAAADAIERGSVLSQYGAHGWLRARAADERGGR